METKIIKNKQDLTWLSWSVFRASSGTAGSFMKSYSELGGNKLYYKLSNFDNTVGVIGHECVNEIIVDRLLTILQIPHLSYQLIHADIKVNGRIFDTYLCVSEDFKQKNDQKIALDVYKNAEGAVDELPLDFCISNGWSREIYQMLIVDFLICNRDRHGANIEVIKNSYKKNITLAPLYDHGLSLLYSCQNESMIDEFDVMKDRECNNYIGSRSTWKNLELIPDDSLILPGTLRYDDKNIVMEGLDGVISQKLQEKTWEMIWQRWCAYEDFCNKRRKR